MTNAIKYAISKGTVVVVAAGNSGSAGVSTSGCIGYSTTVGAVNRSDKVASFSGRGKAVDITAPGVSLVSVWSGLAQTSKSASGKSMATPIVSVTLALIKYENPTYTPSKLNQLCSTLQRTWVRRERTTVWVMEE